MFNPRTLIVARFALIIASLCYSVVEHAGIAMVGVDGPEPLTEALRGAMWDRAVALGRRFAALAARLEAGTLRICFRRRFSRAGTAPAAAPDIAPAGDRGVVLPRDFGWFLRLSPEAHEAVAHLRLLLREPAMAALVGTYPAFGRVVRPLCHMLALPPDPELVALSPLPRRARKPRPPQPRPLPTPDAVPRGETFKRETASGPPGSRQRRRLRNE